MRRTCGVRPRARRPNPVCAPPIRSDTLGSVPIWNVRALARAGVSYAKGVAAKGHSLCKAPDKVDGPGSGQPGGQGGYAAHGVVASRLLGMTKRRDWRLALRRVSPLRAHVPYGNRPLRPETERGAAPAARARQFARSTAPSETWG
ncbi:hypothetical protein CNECB9_3070004 [Cupriavidus necator]|uniref:Uncharacterized protein n=1 Tax=Cupriavidus necator TaxID=106590 RepID=A0A1K0IG82_CUPNE|nr:hypothetical protein CNECB9_3070004 [Cupriavidus necator]